MKKELLAIGLIGLILLLGGCVSNAEKTIPLTEQVITKEIAAPECEKLCIQKKQSGTNLENGPCIGNIFLKNWVCDVAHSPRQSVDDLQENQCSEFGKTAKNFVEVDADCEVIKVYEAE